MMPPRLFDRHMLMSLSPTRIFQAATTYEEAEQVLSTTPDPECGEPTEGTEISPPPDLWVQTRPAPLLPMP